MKLVVFFAGIVCVLSQNPPVAILKQANNLNPDGSYEWSFEAENGIKVEEQGHLTDSKEPAIEAQGSFEYKSPDGTPIVLQYIANEGGFQPSGEHLPTPPPIPLGIVRALEWIQDHPGPDSQS